MYLTVFIKWHISDMKEILLLSFGTFDISVKNVKNIVTNK